MKLSNFDIGEQLGNVFYAIASEQRVKPLEVGELKLLISKGWSGANEKDRTSISDETHFILMTMDALEAAEVSGRDAFNQFAEFYSVYPELFDDEMKRRIIRTAADITKVFKADNASDNANLVALKSLFKSVRQNA